MIFVGNDIMCFKNNYQTFTRIGCNNKILSSFETELLSNNNLHNTILLAWTIKESIYKVMCKEGHKSAFSPTLININEYNKETQSGKALYNNKSYFFQSKINKDFIYSFSSNNLIIHQKIRHFFFSNKISNISSLTNTQFIKFLNKNNWQITHTNNGIPFIYNNQNIDISITHDYNQTVLCEYTK